MVGAILLAAGSGNRMQGEVNDKLLHPIGNSCAFKLSYEAFLKTDSIRMPSDSLQKRLPTFQLEDSV